MDAGRAAGDLEPPVPPSKSPGELLREERIRRKLSVQQAAEDLHLDVRSVEALESNNFQALGAPVYAKGHLRRYAILLGLGPEFIIARYQALYGVQEVPAPISAAVLLRPPRLRMSIRVIRVPWPLVWGAAGSIVGAIVIWELAGWYLHRPVPDPGPIEAPVAAAPAPPPPIIPVGQVTLQLEFTANSWAEVNDATGERLMFDIGQAGQTRMLSGKAPVRVVLGLATAVQMRVNDRPVLIPRQVGKGATRFEVAADGSAR